MRVNRQEIQKIVEDVLDNVGEISYDEGARGPTPPRDSSEDPSSSALTEAGSGTRIIVTALGRNAPGIAAGITGALADVQGNVLDMSQTLLGEFFAMVVVVDISRATTDFGIVKETLMDRGAELGVRVICQHEDVFRSMHRI